MSNIFISYSRSDRPIVQTLAEEFRKNGFTVWYDEQLEGGQEWYKRIVTELRRCQTLVVVLSAAAAASQFVNLEVGIAVGLQKAIIPLAIEPLSSIPNYLSHLQVTPYTDVATIKKLARQIRQQSGDTLFWQQLFDAGLDIGIPLSDYADNEVIFHRSFEAALYLQTNLIRTFTPHFQNDSALRIVCTRPEGRELDTKRHQIFLGGPAGFPYVGNLLRAWNKGAERLHNGYRFVTRPNRFPPGIHNRDSQDGRLGIEDIQQGQAARFHEMLDPTLGKDGINYGIIYTKGFKRSAVAGAKSIILAPFNRYMLEAMVDFLLDSSRRGPWLKNVEQCGLCSETLLRFSFNAGKPPQFAGRDPSRPFGSPP